MLELKNISFHYPNGKCVFENLNIEFANTGMYFLEGENGSGKTTLLRILAKLALPLEGRVILNGRDLSTDSVSYLPSYSSSSFYYLTGEETLKFFSNLNKTKIKDLSWWDHFSELDSFRRALATPYVQCSNGMKQIINFARALTKDSEVLLLDEPFNGLDKNTQFFIENFLESFSTNKLVIFTSHFDINSQNLKKMKIKDGRIGNA